MPVGSAQWGFNQVIKAFSHLYSARAKWITTAEMDFHFILIHWLIPTYSISPTVLIPQHPSASILSLSLSVSLISSHSQSTDGNRRRLFSPTAINICCKNGEQWENIPIINSDCKINYCLHNLNDMTCSHECKNSTVLLMLKPKNTS